jgi:hypothetical protein
LRGLNFLVFEMRERERERERVREREREREIVEIYSYRLDLKCL